MNTFALTSFKKRIYLRGKSPIKLLKKSQANKTNLCTVIAHKLRNVLSFVYIKMSVYDCGMMVHELVNHVLVTKNRKYFKFLYTFRSEPDF